LIYRPISKFDFPQNYGKLTSLDGIQNKAILARFENKSLLYNTLLTIDTSNPKAAYIGNPTLFTGAPPVDFAETDLGYVGSQHKLLMKIPNGQVTIDAKRGQVFLITEEGAKDLSAFGSGLNRFFTDHLAFEILRYFPNADVDNHFNGLGLHGVYDSKYDRIIITKLDYIPINKDIKYDATTKEFYINIATPPLVARQVVYLTDEEYFCNKSWSVSFNFNTNSWVSFHSYIPNWYIGENNFFYSGINNGCEFDALAAEVLPQTTTSTTTALPRPGSTTSTTTTVIDCDLEGNGIIIIPRETTTTTSTSTSTTSSTSTTTTTTTLCPTCDTYKISNNNDCPKEITLDLCNGESVTITINSGDIFVACLCTSPTVPDGFTSQFVTTGCTSCFCYTAENTTSDEQIVTYSDCNNDTQIITIAPNGIAYICAIFNTVVFPSGVILSSPGETCTESAVCDPCYSTTTTTTTIPCICYTVTATSYCYAEWINCDGTSGTNDFLIQPTITICAQENSLNVVGLYPLCDPIVTPNGSCTTVGDCPTTSTTTTIPKQICLNVNGSFDNDLSGWTVSPAGNWSWSSNYGGSANYTDADEGGFLSQDILTVGSTYRITFDYYINNNTNGTILVTYAGTANSGSLPNTDGTHFADVTLTCTDNGTFKIFGYNDGNFDPSVLFIDNVCVELVSP